MLSSYIMNSSGNTSLYQSGISWEYSEQLRLSESIRPLRRG
jgi:hypothetical protein